MTFDKPDATEQLIRLAKTIPNHLCALFAKSYSKVIVPVARSYVNSGGGVGLWERVAGWYAEAVKVECPESDGKGNGNVPDSSVTLSET